MYVFPSTLCNIVSSFFAFIFWCDFCVGVFFGVFFVASDGVIKRIGLILLERVLNLHVSLYSHIK